jgi:hypothetical protein
VKPKKQWRLAKGRATEVGQSDATGLVSIGEVTVSSLVVTTFGAIAVTFMMVMYALERRHPGFVFAFAVGCLLSSAYGFLSGAWPFGVVEVIWAVVAARRYLGVRARRPVI